MKLKMLDIDLGFIGAGNMAQAIAFRLIDEGVVDPKRVITSAPSERNSDAWRKKSVKTVTNNVSVVENSKIVFIAVKPQFFDDAVASLEQTSKYKVECFVSIMAGKPINTIKEALRKTFTNVSIVRVMPNMPCSVGMGCSVMCADEVTHNSQMVEKMLMCIGTYDIIPESLFNSVSGLSGSGPAYMYIVIEAMADGAVRKGVPRELALKLASQVMKGAAEMVLETKKHPGLLKDEVCSPGGTTIAGVLALEKAAVRSAFMEAIEAASKRAEELSK